jgi:hypothetical protein
MYMDTQAHTYILSFRASTDKGLDVISMHTVPEFHKTLSFFKRGERDSMFLEDTER